jgi:hypothetical protein
MLFCTNKINKKFVGHMFYFSKRIAIMLLLLFNIQSSFAAGLYYQDQDLKGFFDSISKEPDNNPHAKKLIVIQTSLILDQNPKAYDEMTENLNGVTTHLKSAIVQGIVNIKGKDVGVNKNYNLTPDAVIDEVNNGSFVFPVNNLEDMDKNTREADYLWAAFNITGNKDYIMRIIAFLSKFSKESKILAAEFQNTQMLDQMQKGLGVENASLAKDFLSSLPKEQLPEVITYNIIEWSLSSHMRQYPVIKSMVEEIFSKHPEMDLYKDLANQR